MRLYNDTMGRRPHPLLRRADSGRGDRSGRAGNGMRALGTGRADGRTPAPGSIVSRSMPPTPAFVVVPRTVQLEGRGDVFNSREAIEQVEFLEDVAHAAATKPCTLVVAHGGDVLPNNPDLAVVGSSSVPAMVSRELFPEPLGPVVRCSSCSRSSRPTRSTCWRNGPASAATSSRPPTPTHWTDLQVSPARPSRQRSAGR